MKQTQSWFAVRKALSPIQARWLTLLSFLLPLMVWSIVSYVPFVWHPKVEITEPGDVSWFQEGMLIDRSIFLPRKRKLSPTTQKYRWALEPIRFTYPRHMK